MNQYDQHWKENLYDREMKFSPQVWENVAGHLDQQKKKRIGIWWIFGISTGLLIISGIFWMLLNEIPNDLETKKEIANTIELKTEANQDIQGDSEASQIINENSISSLPETTIPNEQTSAKPLRNTIIANNTSENHSSELAEILKPSALLNPTKPMILEVPEERTTVETPYLPLLQPSIITKKVLPDCPVFGGRRNGILSGHFYASLAYLPGYALKHLSSIQPENNAYVDERRNTETLLFDQGVALKIGYASPMGISLSTGLTFQSLHERFDFRRDSITGIVTTITIDTTFNPDGSFSITRDTNQVTRLGRLEKTTYNTFRTLDIPILAGYEWHLDNWMLKWQGGIILNLWLAKKGEILNTSLDPQKFSDNNDAFFKDQWGISIVSHLGAYYKLNSRIYAMIEPSIIWPLKPISKVSYAIEQRMTRINLNLGIQYNF